MVGFWFSGVRPWFAYRFLAGSSAENAVFLSQKHGQNVVISVVAVVLSLVVFGRAFWLVGAGDDLGGCHETHRTGR